MYVRVSYFCPHLPQHTKKYGQPIFFFSPLRPPPSIVLSLPQHRFVSGGCSSEGGRRERPECERGAGSPFFFFQKFFSHSFYFLARSAGSSTTPNHSYQTARNGAFHHLEEVLFRLGMAIGRKNRENHFARRESRGERTNRMRYGKSQVFFLSETGEKVPQEMKLQEKSETERERRSFS